MRVSSIVVDGKMIAEGPLEHEDLILEIVARYNEAPILADALSELQEAVDFETVTKDGDLADEFGPGAMERLKAASKKAYAVIGEISARVSLRKKSQVETRCADVPSSNWGVVLEEIREIFGTDSLHEQILVALENFEVGVPFFPSSVAVKMERISPEIYPALVWIAGRGLLEERFVFAEQGPRTPFGEAGFEEIPIPRREAYQAMATGSLTLPDGRTLSRMEFESKLFACFVRKG